MLGCINRTIKFSVDGLVYTLTIKALLIAFFSLSIATCFLAIVLNYIFGIYLMPVSLIMAPCIVIGTYAQLDDFINPFILRLVGNNLVAQDKNEDNSEQLRSDTS